LCALDEGLHVIVLLVQAL
jgi:hypothetical protein